MVDTLSHHLSHKLKVQLSPRYAANKRASAKRNVVETFWAGRGRFCRWLDLGKWSK